MLLNKELGRYTKSKNILESIYEMNRSFPLVKTQYSKIKDELLDLIDQEETLSMMSGTLSPQSSIYDLERIRQGSVEHFAPTGSVTDKN